MQKYFRLSVHCSYNTINLHVMNNFSCKVWSFKNQGKLYRNWPSLFTQWVILNTSRDINEEFLTAQKLFYKVSSDVNDWSYIYSGRNKFEMLLDNIEKSFDIFVISNEKLDSFFLVRQAIFGRVFTSI